VKEAGCGISSLGMKLNELNDMERERGGRRLEELEGSYGDGFVFCSERILLPFEVVPFIEYVGLPSTVVLSLGSGKTEQQKNGLVFRVEGK